MRRFIVLLLLVGFALQGVTALAAMHRCCPMMADHSEQSSSPSDDCCVDLATWAKTGKACKDGLSSAAAQLTLPLARCESAAFAAQGAWRPDFRLLCPPSIALAEVWRPPLP